MTKCHRTKSILKKHRYLREVQVGLRQRLGLLVKRIDERAVALDFLLDLPLFASQCLGGELVVTHLLTGHLSKGFHSPRLHVIGVCLELVQGHCFFKALLSELSCLD